MKQDNLSRQVLNTIEQEQIKPRPKWAFWLKNYLLWLLAGAALLSSGLALSAIIFIIADNDWEVYQHIAGSLPEFILLTLPYFWLGFLILFIMAADYNVKHTKKGYRYQLRTIIASSILVSSVLGFAFYNVGLGQAIDDTLTVKLPVYSNMMHQRRNIWLQPGKGLLIGTVNSIDNSGNIVLTDLSNQQWHILVDELNLYRGRLILPGVRLKIIGQQLNDNNFKANYLRPLLDHHGWLRISPMMEGRGREIPVNKRFKIKELDLSESL
jgi:small nuclear ribonucleoprotein (snRNP)-like protein